MCGMLIPRYVRPIRTPHELTFFLFIVSVRALERFVPHVRTVSESVEKIDREAGWEIVHLLK
jgi:hypothetical protein